MTTEIEKLTEALNASDDRRRPERIQRIIWLTEHENLPGAIMGRTEIGRSYWWMPRVHAFAKALLSEAKTGSKTVPQRATPVAALAKNIAVPAWYIRRTARFAVDIAPPKGSKGRPDPLASVQTCQNLPLPGVFTCQIGL